MIDPTATPTPVAVVVSKTTQYLAFISPIILAAIPFIFGKLRTIHELVNSRLTEALAKIDVLERRLQALTGEPPTGEPPQPTSKTN